MQSCPGLSQRCKKPSAVDRHDVALTTMRSSIETAQQVRLRIREVRANQLVSALVLQTFVSLFPLLLVAIAALGFVAAHRHGSEDIAARLITNLKLKGDVAGLVKSNLESAKSSRKAASVVGLASLLVSGLGVVGAIAQACDAVWQVPQRGWKDKALGVVWLLGAAVVIAASAGAVALVRIVPFGPFGVLVGFLAGGATGALLFWWTQVAFTNVRVPRRAFVPGAIVGGIGLSLFQLFGAFIVVRLVKNASQLYASLAAVFALLTFLSLFAWLLVLSIVVNVVIWEREHGTVQLAIAAPALPQGSWAVVERGGQRPLIKPKESLLSRLRHR